MQAIHIEQITRTTRARLAGTARDDLLGAIDSKIRDIWNASGAVRASSP